MLGTGDTKINKIQSFSQWADSCLDDSSADTDADKVTFCFFLNLPSLSLSSGESRGLFTSITSQR